MAIHRGKTYRYTIMMGKRKFPNTGSFGLKSLAIQKASKIKIARKKAGLPYGNIRVKRYNAKSRGY